MKTITIGFSRSKKKFAIGSWALCKYMGTEFSHVYVKFRSDSLDRDLIYEAVGSGVRFIGSKAWSSHAEEVASFSIEITDEQYILFLRYCVDNAGKEYGFMQNIGVFIANIFGSKKNLFTEGVNCSETESEILKLIGKPMDKDQNLITPRDIYHFFEKISPPKWLTILKNR